MRYVLPLSLVLLSFSIAPAFSQDAEKPEDVVRLKERIELLEAKLKAVELERDALQSRVDKLEAKKESHKDQPDKDMADLFEIGATWQGSRFYTQAGADPLAPQEWKLVITERDGKKFKGDIHFRSIDNLNQTLAVSGLAPISESGKVTFKTEQKGVFQQNFSGVLKGGQISLEFKGTGVTGGPVTGTGNLKL